MNKIMKMIISFLVVAGGGTLVVKAEDLTIKSIERSEVEERVKVENEVIHFDDYDEYATYTLTLENPTSTKLQITNINLTNNECVTLDTSNLENTIVEPNSTKEVTLTLTSNKCNVNQDNTALLTFKSMQYIDNNEQQNDEDNSKIEKEDIVSPNTYGNISIFLVILFILTAIYISLYIYSKKKPFKHLKLSTIIYLSLLVITTIAYTIMTSFSANEEVLTVNLPYTYEPKRVLMARKYEINGDAVWWDEIYRDDDGTFWENRFNVKNIFFQDTIEEPSNYEEVYDASMNQDESILVYKVINPGNSRYYDLYFMADGKIMGNIDSSFLFCSLVDLDEINGLENLDFSETKNMSYMFAATDLDTIDLSYFNSPVLENMQGMFNETTMNTLSFSGFNTSNVTNMGILFAASNIVEILDLSILDTSKLTDMSWMFSGYSSSAPLDLSHFDTSNVTDMSQMFYGYSSSAALDLSHFDTSNVTDMSQMFKQYSSIATLDLSSFNTSNVTDMSEMFWNYSSNTPLDLSHFDTSKVTDMSRMFYGYRSNTPLDLSHFDTSKVTDMSRMFGWWNSTADLDISSINFTVLPQNMFEYKQKANKIYVANDTVRNLLKNSGWPYMTDENIIVKSN